MDIREWSAWLNTQPPPPDDLHVIGQVLVGNPGIVPILIERSPPGFNPAILILDLHLIQRPGFWPTVMTWKEARFDKVYQPGGNRPSQVDVTYNGVTLVLLDVDVVS